MKQLRFVHISDTHILKDYEGSMLEGIIGNGGKSPEVLLGEAAEYIKSNLAGLDFILVTGDLVHEGTDVDYAKLKQVLADCFGEIPVYLCIGNHDRRPAFREGYLGEAPTNEKYYYSTQIGDTGVRLIALDSSHDHSGMGALDAEQLEWLKNEVATKSENGTMLIIHHPPFFASSDPMVAAHGLAKSDELYEIIKDSDVYAIFSGHTHQVSATTFGTIPHFTADSTAFGVGVDSENMTMNNRVGIVSCTSDNERVAANHIAYTLPVANNVKIPIAELLKMMQAH